MTNKIDLDINTDNKPLKIACIGEAMIEMVADHVPGNAALNIAGDMLNTAVYLRRALPMIHEVSFVTKLGVDHLSDQMIDFVKSQNINADHIERDNSRVPGIYSITTDEDGERNFQYWRDHSAARLLFQKGDETSFVILKSFDVLHMSAITLAILPHKVRIELLNWIEQYRAGGGLFSFDSNYRPRLWESQDIARITIDKAWSQCDIALPSIDDEMALFGDKNENEVLARFAKYASCKGALKRGAEGPLPINIKISEEILYPKADKVVDTTAAGDSFSGAFLASFLTDKDLAKAMMRGHQCAAHVIGHRGAIVPETNQHELND